MADAITTQSSKLTKEEFYQPSISKKTDGRRKTAAERLEADKLKYVKSAEARKANLFRDSQSINGDEKKIEKTGSDACLQRLSTDSNRKRNRLNRSNTDANMNERFRMLTSNRIRSSSTTENNYNSVLTSSNCSQTNKKSARDEISSQTSPFKDGKNTKLSTYFSKAKESLKSVTSSITSSGLDGSRLRQSRSAEPKSSKYRSSSVGANTQRHLNVKAEISKSPSFQRAALSPRSQLKNARHKLKKVAQVNQNNTFSPARRHAKTFLVDPQQMSAQSKVNPSGGKLSHHSQQCDKRGKPLAVIDNTVTSSRSEHLRNNFPSETRKAEISLQRQSSNPIATKNEICQSKDEITVIQISGESISTRSEDRKHSPESNLPMPVSKSSSFQVKNLHPPLLSSNPQLGSAPPQRKMGGRLANSSDSKKIASRVSFHEDLSISNSGLRKSITEALENLINRDDDIDTAYNSMSPVASLDCKLQLASSAQASDKTFRSRSKTPESSRSRTPTCDDGISFNTTDPELASKDQQQSPTESEERKIPFKSSNLARGNDDVQPVEHEVQAQRLQRIISNDNTVTSSMLAPKERKEVAPEYSISNKSSLCKDFTDTLKSQNTSSSASADINKPLTALTAADLKPRGDSRNVDPLKSGFHHPALRGIPKRRYNAPALQQLSSSKQVARMASSQGSQSSSSPRSSLKRTPASSHNSSLKRSRQRSKSDVSLFQNELDRFFSSMGMDESLTSPLSSAQDTLFTTAPFGSESDFAFSTASACVRDSVDDLMEVDPQTAKLTNAPSVSIVEKKARVVRWVMSINKSLPTTNPSPRSPRRAPLPVVPPRPRAKVQLSEKPSSDPPPIPPRTKSNEKYFVKESDV